MKLDALRQLNEARERRRLAFVVTRLSDGAQRLVAEADISSDPLAETLAAAARTGKGVIVEGEGGEHFVAPHVPPARVLAVGAVHISQALAGLCRVVGLDLHVIDPRDAFAAPERFPGARLIAEWPDVALPPLAPDRRTAVLALTHDPKIDDPALEIALRSDAFYVGALGSRKTHARRLERLRAAGFDEAALARIHAPIGLPIGAANPAEIAVAILAEIIAALRQPAGAGTP